MNTNTEIKVMKSQRYVAVYYGFMLTILLALTSFMSPVFAKGGVNLDSTGLAIKGYDPVAYFTESKAVKGKSEFTVDYKGNKWALSSDANKQLFVANPEAYIPQFGGFCAFAASKNAIAPIDPEAWAIHDNKLFLYYNKTVQSKWLSDKVGNIDKADAYWPELMKQVPEK